MSISSQKDRNRNFFNLGKKRTEIVNSLIHTHVSIQYLKNETNGNIKRMFTFDSQIEEDFKVCVSRRSQSPLSHYQVAPYQRHAVLVKKMMPHVHLEAGPSTHCYIENQFLFNFIHLR